MATHVAPTDTAAVDELARMVSARSFAVASATTGEMVVKQAVDDQFHIASITKVLTFMTAHTFFKQTQGVTTSLNKVIKVSPHAAAVQQGTTARLTTGDQLTVKQARSSPFGRIPTHTA